MKTYDVILTYRNKSVKVDTLNSEAIDPKGLKKDLTAYVKRVVDDDKKTKEHHLLAVQNLGVGICTAFYALR